MKREMNILLLACLLTVIAPLTETPQTQLPDEKKKGMHKLDPTDVLLEPQDRRRGRRGRRQNTRGSSAAVLGSSSGQDSSSGRSDRDRTPAETPTPAPSPSPTATATPETTPTPTPTPEAEASGVVLSASQPSVPPSSPTTTDKVGVMENLSITFIVTLLGLILVALIVVLVKLKNQLRSP